MSSASKIEWTNATWNPVRGCSIVSKGCTNCYAMRQAHRQSGKGRAYEGLTKMTKGGPVWTGSVRAVEEMLDYPSRLKRPHRIFVNSMSDLFHDAVPDDFIAKVWQQMAWLQRHTFQILTKRPARMLEWVSRHGQNAVFYGEEPEYKASLKEHDWPLRNVWLGVSVEDQASADERIPLLLQTPATVRWISAEPLLGPIDFEGCWVDHANPAVHENWLEALDWVVAGGESGPGARPMHPDWPRLLRNECAAFGTPFFFKQWGHYYAGGERAVFVGENAEVLQFSDGVTAWPVGKKAAGRMLDGRTHDEYPA